MKDSLQRFFYTYVRILKLAYQIHPGLLILLTIINLGWGLTNLPVLYINKILIDLVIASAGKPDWQLAVKTIFFLVLAKTGIDVLRGILSRINHNISYAFGNLMSDEINIILGKKLNSLDVPMIESAEFQDRYAKINRQSHNRIWGMLSTLQEFPNAVTTIISGLIPVFTFNPLISIVVLLVGIPDALTSAKLVKIDYESREKKNRLYRILGWLNWIVTATQQFYENKILGNVSYVAEKMKGLQKEIFDHELELRTRRVKWRTISEIPQWVVSMLLNIYFFSLAVAGKLSLGTAQMLYQSASTLGNGMSMFLNNVAVVYEHYLFVSDFTWFMDLSSQTKLGTISFPEKLTMGIEYKDVWFKYPNSKDWILKGVNFTIDTDDDVAIVGENGAGKTTLLKLLLGFYVPEKGEILIDGINISEYDKESYWKQIAALSQDFHLYPFSARESISFSNLARVSELESIQEAAQKAQIHDYISNLPHGYDTPLTKDLDGVEPSGGQKQRIAIARTLFKGGQIMILDEPTSNVDPKAEEEIFKNIIEQTKDQILILVSHRFSTVRRADKIILLEDGKITESGSHTQLMKIKGKYAHLFNLQAKSYQ